MYRSIILTPADDLHKITKAINSVADAVLIDMEDSIAPSAKASAREIMTQAPSADIPVYVRVNPVSEEYFTDDVDAVSGMDCQGIVVPKVESAADMEICNRYVTKVGQGAGHGETGLDVIPVIETAKGVVNMREILQAATCSSRASFGAGDLTADTGMEWTEDELTLHVVRTQMAIESKAAGLLPPLDTPHWEFRDMEKLKASAIRGRQLGFGGKICIHPAQLQVVNEVFSPTNAEIAWAQKVITEFEAAEAEGKGCITVDGQMVDIAVAKRARSILYQQEQTQ